VVITDIVNCNSEIEKEIRFIKCDNRVENEIVQMVREVIDSFSHIDVLINNAGILLEKPATEIEVSEWEGVFRINVTGTFLVSREVGKIMIKQGKGRIINIASQYGSVGANGLLAYAASKAAIINMTRGLALEWARYGVRVNTLSPASTRTEMSKERHSDPRLKEFYERAYPVGRVLETEDLLGAAILLASDASEMITGHNLIVDGGYLIQ
jgi:NAD(P)-dependent dehydrogenase (short-subunit alcohol dehydrogenase family)